MQCTLCPRACRAERNESTGNGFCQLPTTMRIARIAPHLWEEPPISGKNGTGAVFFSGCTLRCAYCQNADISHRNAGRPFTPRELADSLRRLEDMGMHTISFITATPYVPQILETLDIYRPHVPLVWNTSGYETVETLRMLDGVMDVYLPDLKHRSEKMGQLCAKASNYFAATSAAITEMVRQTGTPVYDENGIMTRGTLIRHLILPGSDERKLSAAGWVKENLPEGCAGQPDAAVHPVQQRVDSGLDADDYEPRIYPRAQPYAGFGTAGVFAGAGKRIGGFCARFLQGRKLCVKNAP